MNTSPFLSVVDGATEIDRWSAGSLRSLAITWPRARRNASACALPRPSAIASAKLANSTVNHSHTATLRMNPAGASP